MNPPKRRKPRSPEYARLVRIFPLEPIRDDDHLDAASAMCDYVLTLGEEDPGVVDYLEVLTGLILVRQEQDPIPRATEAEAFLTVMEDWELDAAALGAEVGVPAGAIAAFLAGDAAFTPEEAAKLGRRFALNPSFFSDREPGPVRPARPKVPSVDPSRCIDWRRGVPPGFGGELAAELEVYVARLDELLEREGDYVVISGGEVLGIHETLEQAAAAAGDRLGRVPVLIKPILRYQPFLDMGGVAL